MLNHYMPVMLGCDEGITVHAYIYAYMLGIYHFICNCHLMFLFSYASVI
jgi:hypothetical protein